MSKPGSFDPGLFSFYGKGIWNVLLGGCSSHKEYVSASTTIRDNTPVCLVPAADGITVYGNDLASLDAAHALPTALPWIFSPLLMDIWAMILPDGCPHLHKAPTDPAHTVQQVVTLFTEGKPLFIKRIFCFDLRIKLSDIFIHIVKIGGIRHILCQTPPAYSLFHYALISICTTLHAGSSTARSPASVIL